MPSCSRLVLSLALLVPCTTWSEPDSAWLALGEEQAVPAWRAGTLVLDFPCGEFRSSG
jgi:hypothetical protein